MLDLVFLAILDAVLLYFLHNFLAPKIKFNHLQTTVYSIIFALPFERIPTIEIAGVNVKISYLLTLFGIYLAGTLVAKKDAQILKTKLTWWHSLGLIFLIFSSYSWFSIVAPTRFLATFVATVVVILASILISLFAKDILKALKVLTFSMILTQIFGIYQFVGDMIGIPCQLTGLRCNFYTKDIFGIPRIHSTAIEPQHYATFCTWMIFFATLCLIYKVNLFEGIKKFEFLTKHFQAVNFGILVLSGLSLLLTVSKGAIAIFVCIIPLFIFTIFRKQNIWTFIKNSWHSIALWTRTIGIAIFSVFFGTLVFFGATDGNPISKIWLNVVETVLGTSPTSVERDNFVSQALAVLPENVLSGIGFGQFGTIAGDLPTLIVNNAYLEVWLEAGFLAFVVFCFMFFVPLFALGKQIFGKYSLTLPQSAKLYKNQLKSEIIALTLFFSLLLALIQWLVFSPIYIMPFYIILGLVVSFNNQEE